MKRGDLWSKVDKTDSCWNWTAALNHYGYGVVRVEKRARMAHRHIYELLVGPIPERRDLDHLCRNRRCVNPAHLEPVSRRTNLLRGQTITARNAAVTHCPHGHEYTAANTITFRKKNGGESRVCRTCFNASVKRIKARKRERAA